MYTDTQRPNHLAQEVIHNGALEAVEGHCTQIDVTLFGDGSLQVADDGRGLPVEIDPLANVSALELILTELYCPPPPRLGLAVVNALSRRLDCWVRRGTEEYFISFRDGELHSKLTVTRSIDRHTTGTTLRFWPDPTFFDSGTFSVPDLQHTLRVKAALCPGLRVTFSNEATGKKDEWFFTDDLRTYLIERLGQSERLPVEPITGGCHADSVVVDYALNWALDGRAVVRESYVNLLPSRKGGTQVEELLRAGVARAVRQFSEARGLVPHSIELAPEDVWEKASFVLSAKIQTEDLGGGLTDGRLASSHAALVKSLASDSMSRWLQLHPDAAERIARLALATARERIRDGR